MNVPISIFVSIFNKINFYGSSKALQNNLGFLVSSLVSQLGLASIALMLLAPCRGSLL